VLFHNIFDAQMSVKNCFIRGSVVRYVQLPSGLGATPFDLSMLLLGVLSVMRIRFDVMQPLLGPSAAA
jgi:hypothetical protein